MKCWRRWVRWCARSAAIKNAGRRFFQNIANHLPD